MRPMAKRVSTQVLSEMWISLKTMPFDREVAYHPDLWGLLPEKTDPVPVVPEWPQFLRGRTSTDSPSTSRRQIAPRTDEPYEE